MSTIASLPRLRAVATISALLLAALSSAGCAGILSGLRVTGEHEERFRRATARMEEGRLDRAATELRMLASRCESGRWGREALLVLAAVEVDPRNPRAYPAAAAHLAARYLQEPSLPEGTEAVAEAVYLFALDLGAPAVDDPFAPIPRLAPRLGVASRGRPAPAPGGHWRVAGRFDFCGSRGAQVVRRPLPDHPGPTRWRTLREIEAERDGLQARLDSLRHRADNLRAARELDLMRAQRFQERIDSLETELARIRGLLRSGLPSPVDPSDKP